MPYIDVSVKQAESGSWYVEQPQNGKPSRHFKNKEIALAFARALAYSSGGNLYVSGPDGVGERQPKESLTYPINLD